ncbi:MAG TPA: metallophosphoesterase family protein [Mesorhizobium sp.]|jgi:calcineurin-like phosphoesterase family protein|nr:metallophosphoesterase family protein [Mesorhizobium sp.]
MIFFTSDTHFSDPRVLRIDRRPFASLAEHDEALIENWNAAVGSADEVWHLGDFCRAGPPGHAEALLRRLNGRKHLVIGNNDGPDTLHAPGWASRQHYAELAVDGQRLVLCHYPFRTWNGMGRRAVNLHGHSHGRLKPMTRQYDVGVDPQGLRPVTLEAILAGRRRARATSPPAGKPA